MGTVYLAERDDEQFRKLVAIKVVSRGMDTAALLGRVRHERQILARLEHPYIARLLDGGSIADGRPFLVMEHVDGQPITAWCAQRRLGVRERIELFRKVCAAVESAHQNLVVHRDLKPGNILVDAEGMPKLLDFGIARLLDPATAPQFTVSGDGLRLLTPDYASPEQVMGLPVNTSSDVYSLGVILYELLSGVRPHRLEKYTADEIQRAICHEEPVRPSTAGCHAAPNGRGSSDQEPGDLDDIVLMALQKEPGRRYGSVAAFSADLGDYLAGLPVRAREDTVLYRAGKFVRRHKAMVAAAVLLVATLSGGVAVSTVQARRAEAQTRRAEQRLGQMLELANRTLFDVHGAIERLPGATEARKRLVGSTLDFLDRLAAESGNDVRVRLALASAYSQMAAIRGYPGRPNLGDPQGALEVYRKAGAIVADLLQKSPGNLVYLQRQAEISQGTANLLFELGSAQDALAEARRGIQATETLLAKVPSHRDMRKRSAELRLDVAEMVKERDSASAEREILQYLPEFARLADESPGDTESHILLAHAYSQLAITAGLQNEVFSRQEYFRRAVDLLQSVLRLQPQDVVARRDLMMAYGHLADSLEAGPAPEAASRESAYYRREAARLAEALSGIDPANRTARIDAALTYVRLANVRGPEAQIPERLRQTDKAAAILEPMVLESPENMRLRLGLSYVYATRGQQLKRQRHYREALRAFRQAVEQTAIYKARTPGSYADTEHVQFEAAMASLLGILGERAELQTVIPGMIVEGASLTAQPVYAPSALGWAGDACAELARRPGSAAQRVADWRIAADYYRNADDAWAKVPEADRNHSHVQIDANRAALAVARRELERATAAFERSSAGNPISQVW